MGVRYAAIPERRVKVERATKYNFESKCVTKCNFVTSPGRQLPKKYGRAG